MAFWVFPALVVRNSGKRNKRSIKKVIVPDLAIQIFDKKYNELNSQDLKSRLASQIAAELSTIKTNITSDLKPSKRKSYEYLEGNNDYWMKVPVTFDAPIRKIGFFEGWVPYITTKANTISALTGIVTAILSIGLKFSFTATIYPITGGAIDWLVNEIYFLYGEGPEVSIDWGKKLDAYFAGTSGNNQSTGPDNNRSSWTPAFILARSALLILLVGNYWVDTSRQDEEIRSLANAGFSEGSFIPAEIILLTRWAAFLSYIISGLPHGHSFMSGAEQDARQWINRKFAEVSKIFGGSSEPGNEHREEEHLPFGAFLNSRVTELRTITIGKGPQFWSTESCIKEPEFSELEPINNSSHFLLN